MNMINRPLYWLLALGAFAGSGAQQAMAFSALFYTYFQDGYSEGAFVSGSFAGVDLDNNGLLVHFPDDGGSLPIENLELTSLSMHFSGNSLSPAFDLTLDDLYGFVYEIGTPGLGDDPAFDPTINRNLTEGIGLIGADHFYTSGLGPNNFIGGYVGGSIDLNNIGALADHLLDSTENLVQVAPVPEAASAGMIIVAAMAIDAVGRRRRSSM